jgi:integrase/recombinase XerD
MTKQMSPLRQRMIEDMTIRNMSPSTQKIYVAAVANFSIFHGRSPDKLTFEDVRDYRLHLISRGLKPNSINPIMGALRFFYRTTLGRKEVSEHIPYARRADPLPAVLARDEVERFLKAVPDLKMRTAFITIYAAGLRVSEVVKLTARDIDSARMVIIIRQSKGRKDRYVMLSEQLLSILRDYWKRERPQNWLFPGHPGRRITTRQLQRVCHRAHRGGNIRQNEYLLRLAATGLGRLLQSLIPAFDGRPDAEALGSEPPLHARRSGPP